MTPAPARASRSDPIGPLTAKAEGRLTRGVGGHARRQLERRRRAGERRLDVMAREVAQLLKRALLHQPALAQDADPVAQRLDLAQDVRREEDRLAAPARLADGVAERHLHQRVEAARGLVEHQQVGTGPEGGDELDLLAVPFRVVAHALSGVEVEALDELAPVRAVDGAVQVGHELEALLARERRPQQRLAGDVGQAAVRRHRVGPGIDPEHPRAAGARPVQTEEQPDGRRLSGPVRPQIAVDLTGGDRQVEPVEGERRPVALGEPLGVDDEVVRRRQASVLRARLGATRAGSLGIFG